MENGAVNSLNSSGDSNANLNDTHRPHKRTPSGGLLSRLPSFLRASPDDRIPPSTTSAVGQSPTDSPFPGEEPLHHGLTRDTDSAMAALRQHKTRKRKGSLRKTALLGGGRLKMDRQNGTYPNGIQEPEKSPPKNSDRGFTSSGREIRGMNDRATSISESIMSSFDLPSSNQPLTLDTMTTTNGQSSTLPQQDPQLLSPDSINSPVTSPTSRYASTTSDDDGIHLNITSAADLTRRRSTLRTPVVASPARAAQSPPPHSYSETEWWGWIILFTTWIVFVVGMGSCLGVWSWAWDVGETPYAPPELEDDPTLPIVGYYPALIVCTGVMAWVWVVVAWVGMKYFRHARFEKPGPDDKDN